MQKVLLITGLLLLMGVITARAQSVSYKYDASGNRVKRITIPLKSASKADEKEEEPIETTWGKREVTIFPNPTKESLKISIKGGDDDEVVYRYTLFNSGGRLLKQGNIQGSGITPLAMDTYETGIYLLVLQSEDEEMTFKIMKE
ncbi:MAG: T9SS type A sorting domain-containing protein [Bacteroidota bacterium]